VRLDLRDPRGVMRAVGAAGVGVGLGFAVAPRLGLRVMGLEAEGRGVGFATRLFASRDLAIGAATLLASRREPVDLQWLDLIALFQVSDLVLTGMLWRRGKLSRRAWAVMVGTAVPTLGVALSARLRPAYP
jgi:hypothetical protein